MKAIYIIDDYTEFCLWDLVIDEVLPNLKTRPSGWNDLPANRRERDLPEGDWTLANGMHTIATDNAYKNAGIRRPAFEELPVMFCVHEDGRVEEQTRVRSAEAAAAFLRERIG